MAKNSLKHNQVPDHVFVILCQTSKVYKGVFHHSHIAVVMEDEESANREY